MDRGGEPHAGLDLKADASDISDLWNDIAGSIQRNVSHEFYRVENGLFAEEWICSDMASLFRQLG